MLIEIRIRDAQEDRRQILGQLVPLEAGEMRTGEHRPWSEPLDTTEQNIRRLRSNLADCDAILGELLAEKRCI